MAKRPRLVVLAYACEPGQGSEPGAGWGLVEALRPLADCTVLVGPEHTAGIRDHLREAGGPERDGLSFVEVPEARWGRFAKWHRIPRFLLYLDWLRRARKVARELHRTRPFDVAVHATYSVYWLPSPVVDLGIPSVWGPVGGAVTTPPGLWPLLGPLGVLGEVLDMTAVRLASWLPATRRTWKQATATIFQNAETAGRVHAPEAHELILNHGMFTQVPSVTSEARRGDYVLWSAALEPRKGPRLAVKALAHTPSSVRLVMIGDGPQRRAVIRLARRLGVADRLDLRGRVPREEAIRLMGGAAVALFTGLREEGGLALAEEMLCGTPVVVLGNGGARTLAEAATNRNRVAIVEPGSVDATARRMAAAMTTLAAAGPQASTPLLDQQAATIALREAVAAAANRHG